MNWVSNLSNWEPGPNNTNTSQLVEDGWGPYLSGVRRVHECLSNFSLSDLQRLAGWGTRMHKATETSQIYWEQNVRIKSRHTASAI